jgi:5-methylcytosine-specific restriction endonuclease McrA
MTDRPTGLEKRILREQLHAAAGGRCAYCNRPTRLPLGTVDHYLPEALGGTHDWDNLRWSCFPCNNLKADKHPDDWARTKPAPVADPVTRTKVKQEALALIARRARGLVR